MSVFHLENLDDLRKSNIFQHLTTWNLLSRQKFYPAIQLGENMFGTMTFQWSPSHSLLQGVFCLKKPVLLLEPYRPPHHTTRVKWDVFFLFLLEALQLFFFNKTLKGWVVPAYQHVPTSLRPTPLASRQLVAYHWPGLKVPSSPAGAAGDGGYLWMFGYHKNLYDIKIT